MIINLIFQSRAIYDGFSGKMCNLPRNQIPDDWVESGLHRGHTRGPQLPPGIPGLVSAFTSSLHFIIIKRTKFEAGREESHRVHEIIIRAWAEWNWVSETLTHMARCIVIAFVMAGRRQ